MSMPDGYKLVYEGGHHAVWCNGTQHLYSDGGFAEPECEPSPRTYEEPFACDCALWARRNTGDWSQ